MKGLIIFMAWTDPGLAPCMSSLATYPSCFITTTIPQMLVHLVVKNHTLAFATYLTQMYLVIGVGVAEDILFFYIFQ